MSNKIKALFLAEMRKYKNYDDFLLIHGAIKKVGNNIVVMCFMPEDINKYQDAYISKYKIDIEEMFVFSEIAKIPGGFIPKRFFDEIKKSEVGGKYITLNEFLILHPDKVGIWEEVMKKKWNGSNFV